MFTFIAGATHHRSGGCEIQRAEEVVGDALRKLAREHRRLPEQPASASIAWATAMCSIADSMLACESSRAEHIGDDFFSGERCKGERTNKFLRGASHDDLHANAAVLQQAHNFCRLVGRDSAGNAESNLHRNGARYSLHRV